MSQLSDTGNISYSILSHISRQSIVSQIINTIQNSTEFNSFLDLTGYLNKDISFVLMLKQQIDNNDVNDFSHIIYFSLETQKQESLEIDENLKQKIPYFLPQKFCRGINIPDIMGSIILIDSLSNMKNSSKGLVEIVILETMAS